LLEKEVRNLADAHIYLDPSNPKAPLATDLLLGTQGWRRFATAGTGTISGIVRDSSGAVIPNVTLRATNSATGIPSIKVSDERGVYVFTTMKAGTYSLTAVLPGFQTATVPDLQVTHNVSVRHDLRLDVGRVYDAMTVAAAGAGRGGAQGQAGGVGEGKA